MQANRTFWTHVVDILQTVVLAVAIFLLVYAFLFQPHQVRGESMLPNFINNEYLLTDKFSYRFGGPKRGDVVVFAAPSSPSEDYIKRIIAIPTDEVLLKNGEIYLNGNLLEEAYLPDDFVTNPGSYATDGKVIEVPEGQYFVLGDNRNNSKDSRSFGTVKREKIVGRAWVVYWPPTKAGLIRK